MEFIDLDDLALTLDQAVTEPELPMSRPLSGEILKEIRFLARQRFWQYTPSLLEFETRFEQWLRNEAVDADSAEVMLRLVPILQFVDRDDQVALYRAAFAGPVSRWLMDCANLSFFDPEFQQKMAIATERTWFCPITDSLDISQFCHSNGLTGQKDRPDWRTLRLFSTGERVATYLEDRGFERIVLLDDFIGSGSQSAGPIKFASLLSDRWPVLVVPLVILEQTFDRLASRVAKHANMTIEPVLKVPRGSQVWPSEQPGEHPLFARLRSVLDRTFDHVRVPLAPETDPLVRPLGFGREASPGTLIVQHTNCPNNSLSLIWHNAPNWNALFPRVARATL